MNNWIIKTSYILFLSAVFCSCAHRSQVANKIDTVDLASAYMNRGEVMLSQISDGIEYIRLESVPDYIIDQPYTIAARDSELIIIAFRKILVFERQTGKFKYEIPSYGRGPDEYLFTISNTGYYETEDLIFAGKDLNGKILAFTSDGILKKTFRSPNNLEEDYNVVAAWPYGTDTFIGYPVNYSGVNPFKIEMFDSTGTVLYRFPNYNSFDKNIYSKSTRNLQPDCFFNYSDSVRFIEPLTDSIFTVSQNRLIPRYKISMGDAAPPYYLQGTYYYNDYEHLKYFWLGTFQESSRYLFFTTITNFYSHLCFYDKNLKKTFVCENSDDKEYYKFETRPPRYYTKTRTIGLNNDIDGFLPVGIGFGELFINKNGEMTTFILASDVERWFEKNPDKATRLSADLQKFSDVKATDNIIVMIVRLKK